MNKDTLDFVFNNCPCINLGKAVRSSTRYFDDLLAPYSINAAKLILLISIERHKDGVSQKELVVELSIQQSSLSRSLKDLIDKKWIKYREKNIGTKKNKENIPNRKRSREASRGCTCLGEWL